MAHQMILFLKEKRWLNNFDTIKVMKKEVFLFIIIFFSFLYFFVLGTEAARRILPRFQATSGRTTSSQTVSGVVVSVRFNGARNGLNVYFSNLNKATSVSYMLSYETDGKAEGAGGTIDIEGQNSLNRELLFATCSSGICRYHSNITNARLEITSTLTIGKKTLKRYRIRV